MWDWQLPIPCAFLLSLFEGWGDIYSFFQPLVISPDGHDLSNMINSLEMVSCCWNRLLGEVAAAPSMTSSVILLVFSKSGYSMIPYLPLHSSLPTGPVVFLMWSLTKWSLAQSASSRETLPFSRPSSFDSVSFDLTQSDLVRGIVSYQEQDFLFLFVESQMDTASLFLQPVTFPLTDNTLIYSIIYSSH